MKDTQNPRLYSVAELFCGCGGFSHGFLRSGRFRVILGNDIKKAALKTFAYNHRTKTNTPVVIEGDLRTVTSEEIANHLSKSGIPEGGLDCLIGGPPCQGFSQLRRSEERKDNAIVGFGGYNRLNQDSRNDLVLRFLEIANHLRPKVIVIENVPQMLRHGHKGRPGGLAEDVKNLLNEMGYHVDHRVINAADFGVPQLRERVFFLASRLGPIPFPTPSHSNHIHGGEAKIPWVTVEEAIRDLPPPGKGPTDSLGGGSIQLYRHEHRSRYAQLMQSQCEFPFNHITRTYSSKIIAIIKEMRPGETWDHASARLQEKYRPLVEAEARSGESYEATAKRLSKGGKINLTFYRSYYWSAYTRLSWNEPALTITANANFLGSGRFSHPKENRGITMREAARLQSFEDDFRLITSPDSSESTNRIGVGLDMIGEAVPPLLSQVFASQIARFLDKKESENLLPQQSKTAIPTLTLAG